MTPLLLTKKLASGSTADIYEWTDDQIIKVFHDRIPNHAFFAEMRNAMLVHKSDLPTPSFFGRADADGRRGLVFGRVDGELMSRALWKNPLRVSQFAAVQRKIHAVENWNLPPLVDELNRWIDRAPHLTSGQKHSLRDLLRSLPHGSSICHFDYHADNLIVAKHGIVVIDWATALRGHRLADVAQTWVILTAGTRPARYLPRAAVNLARTCFTEAYLRCYFHGRPEEATRKELNRWITIVAAARLRDKVEHEKETLMNLVERGLHEAAD